MNKDTQQEMPDELWVSPQGWDLENICTGAFRKERIDTVRYIRADLSKSEAVDGYINVEEVPPMPEGHKPIFARGWNAHVDAVAKPTEAKCSCEGPVHGCRTGHIEPVEKPAEEIEGLTTSLLKISHPGHRIRFLIREAGSDGDLEHLLKVIEAARRYAALRQPRKVVEPNVVKTEIIRWMLANANHMDLELAGSELSAHLASKYHLIEKE